MQKNRPAPPPRHPSSSKDSSSLGGDASAAADLKQRSPSFIVGIGASAGGLDSLEKFFRHMTERSGLAFVVIQHLSPDYKSMMVELLSKHTRMAIKQAQNDMEVQPDTVYLIPPKVSLKIAQGKLHLSHRSSHAHVLHLPIDIFFRSLAEDREGRAIGIILSGTGSDGTLGSRAIKEAGGMLMVQDPASAPFDGMPNSAIHTGVADYVLPPEEMPQILLKYVKHPSLTLRDQSLPSSRDEEKLAGILDLIHQEIGLNFSYYKPSTIIRRIERRMGINQIEKLEHYLRYLEHNPDEVQLLHSELLIGVTRFFRDHEAFTIIQQRIIPEIVDAHQAKTKTPIRIWVAGCSSGEEVYSLAILISEYFQENSLNIETKIFATDIDQRAVDIAAAGKYPASIVADVPMPLLSKYFFKTDDHYQIVDKTRKMVIFAQHNLLKDPPFNNLDLVTCRNLLIYLKNEMQHRILSMFGFSLKKNGFLFLGSSETVGNSGDLFAIFDNKWRLYRYKGGASFADLQFFNGDRAERHSRVPLRAAPRLLPLGESDTLMQRVQAHLLDAHVPPTVVLDQDLNLLHTLGEINEFLQLPQGQVSFNIFRLAEKNLSGLISSAIREAKKNQKTVRYKDVALFQKDQKLLVTLLVEPFIDPKSKRRLFLLSFQGAEKVISSLKPSQDLTVSSGQESRIQELEHELQLNRENLQATIEELETSNEELQAANEELMSANEELQSTNEELQSVNEELYTVNSEYQNKIEELTSLNNDMDNLLNSTHVGTLFLDRALRIRKFTPAIKAQFPIMDYDIGRPISHFIGNFNYPEILQEMQKVLDTLTSNERDIKLKNGKAYQVTIQPYRTSSNSIDGLVMTCVDISRRLEMETALRVNEELLEIAAAGANDGLWDWSDAKSDKMRWSNRFFELLGDEPKTLPPRLSTIKSLLHPHDQNRVLEAIQGHLHKHTPFEVECRLRVEVGDYRWYRIRGQAHWNPEGQPTRMAGSLTDIHELKMAQKVLAQHRDTEPEAHTGK